MGVMMVFFFVGLSVAAVGTTAAEVVKEVRRQFAQFPGIMDFTAKPDYRTCVALVSAGDCCAAIIMIIIVIIIVLLLVLRCVCR